MARRSRACRPSTPSTSAPAWAGCGSSPSRSPPGPGSPRAGPSRRRRCSPTWSSSSHCRSRPACSSCWRSTGPAGRPRRSGSTRRRGTSSRTNSASTRGAAAAEDAAPHPGLRPVPGECLPEPGAGRAPARHGGLRCGDVRHGAADDVCARGTAAGPGHPGARTPYATASGPRTVHGPRGPGGPHRGRPRRGSVRDVRAGPRPGRCPDVPPRGGGGTSGRRAAGSGRCQLPLLVGAAVGGPLHDLRLRRWSTGRTRRPPVRCRG